MKNENAWIIIIIMSLYFIGTVCAIMIANAPKPETNPCISHGMKESKATLIDNKRQTVTYQCGRG